MTKRSGSQASVSKRREEARRRQEAQRRQMMIIGGVAVLVVAAIIFFAVVLPRLTGEPEPDATTEGATGELSDDRPLAELEPAERDGYYSEYPEMVIDQDNDYEAVITMADGGQMRLRLFDEEAPLTVNNFVFLANQGFYDGTTFHRVLANFMAQGGDPTGTGGGGPGYQFENETASGLSFDRRGLVAMANAGPDTNGSQFFITFEPVTRLDGGYTIFGELIEGDDVLSSITIRDPELFPEQPGDTIERIDIEVTEPG